uniref:Uncharacterized protein n=1 Tax=Gouania willdenowi TaxID=441366 RepID=A0A8C5DFS3_GOUWI
MSLASPLCSICLDRFSHPASLPCGHCFCLSCIGEYWRIHESCQCPLCKAVFPVRPRLETAPTRRESARAKAGEVSCDFCSGSAAMSCLVCVASYCGDHLEPHYQSGDLGRHRLLSVVKNLEEPRCRLHGKMLERFCSTDQTCVCATCVQTEHRGHRLIPINRAAAKKKDKLKRRLLKLQQNIQERLCEVEKDQLSVAVSGNHRQEEEEALRTLEGEILELKRKRSELELLSHIEDDLRFLQVLTTLTSDSFTEASSVII